MEKFNESSNSTEKDPHIVELTKIIDFVKLNDVDATDVFIAYQLSLGLSVEEIDVAETIDDNVSILADKMTAYQDAGFPLNDLVNLIEVKEEIDSSELVFNNLIEELLLSDNDKNVLRSIVNGKRPGTLTIIDADSGQDLAEAVLADEVNNDDFSAKEIATVLTPFLNNFKDKKIEISFST